MDLSPAFGSLGAGGLILLLLGLFAVDFSIDRHNDDRDDRDDTSL